jgi:DNA invertase Pin-like site-specific DNA recombinase
MPRRTARRTANPLLAVAYVRVSTEEQSLGPDAQRAAIESWAARAKIEIVAWHEDRGVSGAAAIEERPGLLAALAALETHGAGVLVVAKRDRLARDVMLAAMAERLVERVGARVVSAAGEGTESDDPTSVLMRSIIDAFAQYERAVIRSRTKSALAVKRSRGELTGNAPLGMRAVEGRLQVDERETEALAAIRSLRAQGYSLRAIASELEARGIYNRAGRRWHAEAVARALRAA